MAGREHAMQVAAVGDHPGLVERDPLLHPAVERAVQNAAVLGEPVRAVAVEPAAAVVERGGQVPVVQGEQRFDVVRSEEHTSELQSLMRISYAVFCLKKKNKTNKSQNNKEIHKR